MYADRARTAVGGRQRAAGDPAVKRCSVHATRAPEEMTVCMAAARTRYVRRSSLALGTPGARRGRRLPIWRAPQMLG